MSKDKDLINEVADFLVDQVEVGSGSALESDTASRDRVLVGLKETYSLFLEVSRQGKALLEESGGVELPDPIEAIKPGSPSLMDGVPLASTLKINEDEMQRIGLKAIELVDAQKFEEAEQAFTYLTAIDPSRSLHHIGRGQALEALERPDEALESYRLAILADPGGIEGYMMAALCCELLQNWEEADRLVAAGIELLEEKKEGHPEIEQTVVSLNALMDCIKKRRFPAEIKS